MWFTRLFGRKRADVNRDLSENERPKYGMHPLFRSRKVVRVILAQTWPKANRRSGMLAIARLEDDGRISLFDYERKQFYGDAKQGVHFNALV